MSLNSLNSKVATRARPIPTYPHPPDGPGVPDLPTYPLFPWRQGCNISATKAWVSQLNLGFSGDRSCPFMSIFCLGNRILCLDDLHISSELQGRSGSQRWPCRFMQMHAEACMFALRWASDLPTYPRCRAPASRPDLPTYPQALVGLPTLKKHKTQWSARGRSARWSIT